MNTEDIENKPSHIGADHWQEWLDSGVKPAIIALNPRTLEDLDTDLGYEASFPIAEFLNWKPVRFGHQVKPRIRGWAVQGLEPSTGFTTPMEWGRFKPDADTPIQDREKRQPAKYLSPSGKGTSRVTFLAVDDETWQLISDRYQVPIGNYTSFWQWVLDHLCIPISLIEGEKKAGCLLSNGYVAIALPGITGGTRTTDADGEKVAPFLVPDLVPFIQPGRRVDISFDHEVKPKVIWAIQREIAKLGKLCEMSRAQPYVITLPGPQKGADDFIVAQGIDAYHRCYETATPFWLWQTTPYSKLTYPTNLRLNRRYLESIEIPPTEKLIAIKSPKGTGKTQLYVDIVQQATDRGQRVLLIGHRVQLVQAIADRVGIRYVTELRTAQEGRLLGYGLCIDSLHPESQARFEADGWKDAIVIVDETEQVWWHLLSATTEVARHRVVILQQLKELLLNTLESPNGQIYLSDADLTDESIDFIKDLTGLSRLKPYLVVNDWKPEADQWTVHHYNQSKPKTWLTALEWELMEGGRPFIVTHSQKAKSLWSTRSLEAFLAERFPNKTILRIDSESISDPKHPAYGCVSNLNEVLPKYEIVIASPSIETGVSIDIRGHFSSVWGCFQGVCAENSARQSLARVREAVPRHLWVSKRGLQRIGNGSVSHKILMYSQQQLAWANLSTVQNLATMELEELNASTAALEHWARFAARINASVNHYRDVVLEGLRQEGHQVIEAEVLHLDTDYIAAAFEGLKAVRDEHYKRIREAISSAEDITPNQYETLKAQKAKEEADLAKERKHALQQRYLVPVTPELVQADDDGWYPKIRLFYFLAVGREFLQERDKRNLEAELKDNKAWFPSLNQGQIGASIRVLEELGVPRLFQEDKLWSKYSDTVQAIANKATVFSRAVKDTLNVTVTNKMTPIQIVQVLLGKLGIKLHYVGKYTLHEGDRRFDLTSAEETGCERCYSYIPIDDGRNKIFARWIERDTQTRTQYELDTPLSILNNSQEGAA